jgi:hypothetical protein
LTGHDHGSLVHQTCRHGAGKRSLEHTFLQIDIKGCELRLQLCDQRFLGLYLFTPGAGQQLVKLPLRRVETRLPGVDTGIGFV